MTPRLLLVLWLTSLLAVPAYTSHPSSGWLLTPSSQGMDLSYGTVYKRGPTQAQAAAAAQAASKRGSTADASKSLSPPSLFPPYIDFEEQPLCRPVEVTVIVVNVNPRTELVLMSLSSKSDEFHASWFSREVVPPGENATFSVVFLGRHLGRTDATILISTSLGDLKFEVFGTSVRNPNGLRPFVSGRIPQQLRLAQPILYYNPNPFPIKVEEILSSSQEIQLDMNALFLDKTAKTVQISDRVWEIAPYQMKPLIVVVVTSEVNSYVSGYVNIRTNHTQNNAIIPVNVNISDEDGLFYGPGDSLDFSIVYRADPRRHRPLQLLFKDSKPSALATIGDIRVLRCHKVTEPSINCPHVTVHHRRERLQLKPYSWSRVATISLASARLVTSPGVYMGTLAVEYATSRRPTVKRVLEVPFYIDYAEGSLDLPDLNSAFYVGSPPFEPETRTFTINNSLPFPVELSNARIPSNIADIFEVTQFEPTVLASGDHVSLGVRFQANSTDFVAQSSLTVSANASEVPLSIPLYSYNGHLKYAAGDNSNDHIDFDAVPLDDEVTSVLRVLNPNPVSVSLLSYTSTLDEVAVELKHISPSPEHMDLVEYGKIYTSTWKIPSPVEAMDTSDSPAETSHQINAVLDPGYIATFNVKLKPRKGKHFGNLRLRSTYHTIHTPVSYEGTRRLLNLHPTRVQFNASFPWQLLLHNDYGIEFSESMRQLAQPQMIPLYIRPADRNITIDRISTTDPRIVLHQNPAVVRGVRANASASIMLGHVVFNASLGPEESNYMPKVRRHFNSLARPSILTRGDVEEVVRCNKVWNGLVRRSKTRIMAYLTLEASGEKPQVIDVQAGLTKPSILAESSLAFELTHIKTTASRRFVITNPSDLPLLVSVVAVDAIPEGPMIATLENAMGISHTDFKTARQHKGVFFASPSAAEAPCHNCTRDQQDATPGGATTPDASADSFFPEDAVPNDFVRAARETRDLADGALDEDEDCTADHEGTGNAQAAGRGNPAHLQPLILDFDGTAAAAGSKKGRPALVTAAEFLGLSPPSSSSAGGEQDPQDEGTAAAALRASRRRWALLLPPRQNATINVNFAPEETGYISSHLLFVNNLTIAEALHVTGEAGRGSFGFPKTQPNIINGSLTMRIQDAELEQCMRPGGLTHEDAERTFIFNFTVVNRGNMPAVVSDLSVDGRGCTAGGFTLITCEPFVLQPREHYKMVIGFTPDFTSASTRRALTVKLNNVSQLSFPMLAALPPTMLSPCFAALPGPAWAQHFKLFVVLALLAIGVVIAAVEVRYGTLRVTMGRPASWASARRSTSTRHQHAHHHDQGSRRGGGTPASSAPASSSSTSSGKRVQAKQKQSAKDASKERGGAAEASGRRNRPGSKKQQTQSSSAHGAGSSFATSASTSSPRVPVTVAPADAGKVTAGVKKQRGQSRAERASVSSTASASSAAGAHQSTVTDTKAQQPQDLGQRQDVRKPSAGDASSSSSPSPSLSSSHQDAGVSGTTGSQERPAASPSPGPGGLSSHTGEKDAATASAKAERREECATKAPVSDEHKRGKRGKKKPQKASSPVLPRKKAKGKKKKTERAAGTAATEVTSAQSASAEDAERAKSGASTSSPASTPSASAPATSPASLPGQPAAQDVASSSRSSTASSGSTSTSTSSKESQNKAHPDKGVEAAAAAAAAASASSSREARGKQRKGRKRDVTKTERQGGDAGVGSGIGSRRGSGGRSEAASPERAAEEGLTGTSEDDERQEPLHAGGRGAKDVRKGVRSALRRGDMKPRFHQGAAPALKEPGALPAVPNNAELIRQARMQFEERSQHKTAHDAAAHKRMSRGQRHGQHGEQEQAAGQASRKQGAEPHLAQASARVSAQKPGGKTYAQLVEGKPQPQSALLLRDTGDVAEEPPQPLPEIEDKWYQVAGAQAMDDSSVNYRPLQPLVAPLSPAPARDDYPQQLFGRSTSQGASRTDSPMQRWQQQQWHQQHQQPWPQSTSWGQRQPSGDAMHGEQQGASTDSTFGTSIPSLYPHEFSASQEDVRYPSQPRQFQEHRLHQRQQLEFVRQQDRTSVRGPTDGTNTPELGGAGFVGSGPGFGRPAVDNGFPTSEANAPTISPGTDFTWQVREGEQHFGASSTSLPAGYTTAAPYVPQSEALGGHFSQGSSFPTYEPRQHVPQHRAGGGVGYDRRELYGAGEAPVASEPPVSSGAPSSTSAVPFGMAPHLAQPYVPSHQRGPGPLFSDHHPEHQHQHQQRDQQPQGQRQVQGAPPLSQPSGSFDNDPVNRASDFDASWTQALQLLSTSAEQAFAPTRRDQELFAEFNLPSTSADTTSMERAAFYSSLVLTEGPSSPTETPQQQQSTAPLSPPPSVPSLYPWQTAIWAHTGWNEDDEESQDTESWARANVFDPASTK